MKKSRYCDLVTLKKPYESEKKLDLAINTFTIACKHNLME